MGYNYFGGYMTVEQLKDYILKTYKIKGDFPFKEDFETCVFRHKDNKKWFGILMKVNQNKFISGASGQVWVLNLKCESCLIQGLIGSDGVYRAYHMNKNHWVSVIVEQASENGIKFLLDVSYNLTRAKRR